ncbi:MAG: hypothetical protein EBV00_01900, partial [Burkholderiaceae bacterium]|nr:hypothetical protein [Burkholderiaceae bacterium]
MVSSRSSFFGTGVGVVTFAIGAADGVDQRGASDALVVEPIEGHESEHVRQVGIERVGWRMQLAQSGLRPVGLHVKREGRADNVLPVELDVHLMSTGHV